MGKWIAVAGVALALAVAAVVANGGIDLLAEQSESDLGPCRSTPASAEQPVTVVLVGVNASDAELREAHMRHFREVVLPAVERERARLVVGTISGDSARRPRLVADVSFRMTGDGSDNPENQSAFVDDVVMKAVDCVDSAFDGEPADRTDIFGALSWGSGLLPDAAFSRRLVLLTDGINTTEGCNLTGRDATAGGRDGVFADCARGHFEGLARSEVWLAGVGLSAEAGDYAGSLTPGILEEFWSAFVSLHHGVVTRAGATLIAEG